MTSQSINRVSLDSSSYRFSAHWAKIKCSICSSEFDRFERVHATLLMIKRLFGQGSGSGACSCPVMGRLGIAVPPRTAHTHSHFGSVSSYLSKAKLYRQQVVRSFENRRIDVRSLAEAFVFFSPLFSLFLRCCFHFFSTAVFTFSALLFSPFLHCCFVLIVIPTVLPLFQWWFVKLVLGWSRDLRFCHRCTLTPLFRDRNRLFSRGFRCRYVFSYALSRLTAKNCFFSKILEKMFRVLYSARGKIKKRNTSGRFLSSDRFFLSHSFLFNKERWEVTLLSVFVPPKGLLFDLLVFSIQRKGSKATSTSIKSVAKRCNVTLASVQSHAWIFRLLLKISVDRGKIMSLKHTFFDPLRLLDQGAYYYRSTNGKSSSPRACARTIAELRKAYWN